jgi:hypothetical protein
VGYGFGMTYMTLPQHMFELNPILSLLNHEPFTNYGRNGTSLYTKTYGTKIDKFSAKEFLVMYVFSYAVVCYLYK